jgi:hypothetical protein
MWKHEQITQNYTSLRLSRFRHTSFTVSSYSLHSGEHNACILIFLLFSLDKAFKIFLMISQNFSKRFEMWIYLLFNHMAVPVIASHLCRIGHLDTSNFPLIWRTAKINASLWIIDKKHLL